MMIFGSRSTNLLVAIALFPALILVDDMTLTVRKAKADPWSGALGGAIIGGLITGRGGGAVAGAVIGGVAGGIYEHNQRQRWRANRQRQVRYYRRAPQRAYRPAAPRRSGLVFEVQKSLLILGHDPGPADGLSGARTSAAVREYQRKHNLLVDGNITPQLLDHMRAHGG